MKLKTLLAGICLVSSVQALPCTSLIAGKNATADGSVLVTYAADSHTLYGELYHTPAATHEPGYMSGIPESISERYPSPGRPTRRSEI